MKNLLIIFSILFSLQADATTYYVSNSGSNGNTGQTIFDPWATLSQVQATSLSPNDVISFNCGDLFTGSYVAGNSGTSGNPITYTSYGTGLKPRFTGNGASTLAVLFYANNRNYLVFNNLDVQDPTLVGTARDSISHIKIAFEFDGTSHHNIISYCKISFCGDGVYLVGDNNTVMYTEITKLRLIKNTVFVSPATQYDDFGANPIDIESSNNLITHNYFHDNYAPSYDFGWDGGNIEFYSPGPSMDNNVITYNIMDETIGTVEATGDAIDNIFAFNLIRNCGALVYFHSGGNYTGWKFYNNNIVETSASLVGDSYLFDDQNGFQTGQVTMAGNIFYLASGINVAPALTGLTPSYNRYRLSGGSSIGYSLQTGDVSSTAAMWMSTTGSALTWDFHPLDADVLKGGVPGGTGYSVDAYGVTGVNNYLGISKFYSTPPVTGNTIKFPVKVNGKTYTIIQ